jgi:hypothetical protein
MAGGFRCAAWIVAGLAGAAIAAEAQNDARAPGPHSSPGEDAIAIRWTGFSVHAVRSLAESSSFECLHLRGRIVPAPPHHVLAITDARVTAALDAAGRTIDLRPRIPVPADLIDALGDEAPALGPEKPTAVDHRLATYFYHRRTSPVDVAVAIHRLPRLPARMAWLAGEVQVLLATQTTVVEHSMAKLSDLTQLAEDVEVQLHVVTPAHGTSSRIEGLVRKRGSADPRDRQALRQAPLLLNVELLDDAHRPLEHSWVSHAGPVWADGWLQSRMVLEIPATTARPAASARLTLLTGAELRDVRFELRDLPVRELLNNGKERP